MRIIPEYEPVGKIFLSFVRDFYHSRFDYGQTICDILNLVPDGVAAEIFISDDEVPDFQDIMDLNGIPGESVTLNPYSPLRGILAEYFPVFCEDSGGEGIGLHFKADRLDLSDYLHRFSGDIIDSMGISPLRMEEGFATAQISVNEDLCLLSEDDPDGPEARARLEFFRRNFPDQIFVTVPPLAGDLTKDLDMFLWPIRPRVWLVSKYPQGSAQELSVQPSISAIRNHGHEVVPIPGLSPIRYADVNSMPNYANGIILNDTVLFPSYGKEEDDTVSGILESLGYNVGSVDCRRIIESNSGLHCISKTVPASILK